RRSADNAQRLTVVSACGMVGTVATGFLGMNLFAHADLGTWEKAAIFIVVFIPTVFLTAYTVMISRRLATFFEALASERMTCGERPGTQRREWFAKDAKFDEELRRRFGALHEKAAKRELEGWRDSPEPMLALVIALDQLSRNLHRGDARAFAQDGHARECASQAISRGDDLDLIPVQRQFLYLPYEHSESLADQDRAVDLMRSLDGFEETRSLSDY